MFEMASLTEDRRAAEIAKKVSAFSVAWNKGLL